MKNNTLSFGLPFCFFVGLATGCESADNAPFCSEAGGGICEPAGFPFVTFADRRSDACPNGNGVVCTAPLSTTTVALSQPAPGKLCMKGMVAGQAGFAWLILGVSHWNRSATQILDLFDAHARGITAVRFTVDSPPAAGMTLFATTANKTHCSGPPDCLGEGWDLMTGPRSNLVKPIDTSGPLTAPFTNFERQLSPNDVFDTTRLGHFIFVVNPGAYDFCISDFKFLDDQGNEVGPPPTVDAGMSAG